MNLQKLNPWNWFKHEEDSDASSRLVPVTRSDSASANRLTPGQNSLMKLHREMDRLFDDVFNSFGMPAFGGRFPGRETPSLFQPSVDVSGDENSYQILLDVPGMEESDLNIEIKGDMLTIKGKKEEHSENKDKHFYRIERSYGEFQRTLSLPDDANVSDIKARLQKGVLTLDIPRQQSSGEDVKRINISS